MGGVQEKSGPGGETKVHDYGNRIGGGNGASPGSRQGAPSVVPLAMLANWVQ